MRRSLYELNQELQALADMLYETGGEVTEEIDQLLTDTTRATADKVADYIQVIKNCEGLAEAKAAEVKRLGESKRADQNIADKLRARLKWFFEANELKTLRTRLGTVTLSANPSAKKPHLTVDESKVPDDYKIPRTVYDVDYDLIAADLEAGFNLDFAEWPEQTSSIRIR